MAASATAHIWVRLKLGASDRAWRYDALEPSVCCASPPTSSLAIESAAPPKVGLKRMSKICSRCAAG